jgi:hypothetical protein
MYFYAYWFEPDAVCEEFGPWRLVDGVDKGDGGWMTVRFSAGTTKVVGPQQPLYVDSAHYDRLMLHVHTAKRPAFPCLHWTAPPPHDS